MLKKIRMIIYITIYKRQSVSNIYVKKAQKEVFLTSNFQVKSNLKQVIVIGNAAWHS